MFIVHLDGGALIAMTDCLAFRMPECRHPNTDAAIGSDEPCGLNDA
jgi:hypothetical protein